MSLNFRSNQEVTNGNEHFLNHFVDKTAQVAFIVSEKDQKLKWSSSSSLSYNVSEIIVRYHGFTYFLFHHNTGFP